MDRGGLPGRPATTPSTNRLPEEGAMEDLVAAAVVVALAAVTFAWLAFVDRA